MGLCCLNNDTGCYDHHCVCMCADCARVRKGAMTLQAMAQSALDVQSACNLSGVARSFGEVMAAIRALPECTGTDYANRHPVARLYAEQISHLTGAGMGDAETYSAAYDACLKLAGDGR